MYRIVFLTLFLIGGLPYSTITVPRGQQSPVGQVSTGPMSEEHEDERHDDDEFAGERHVDRPPPVGRVAFVAREVVRVAADEQAPALASCVAPPLHPSQYSVRRLI